MTAEEMYEEQIPEGELLKAAPPQSTESPFSMNWRMVDPAGCEVQITLRAGATREIIAEVTGLRRSLVDSAQKAGWTFPGSNRVAGPPPAAPANGTGAPPAVAAAPSTAGAWVPPPPTGPVTQAVAAGGSANPERQTFLAVKLTITPRADGKVDAGWFEAGHQWADVKTTKNPVDLLRILAPTGAWGQEHVTAPGEYQVRHVVEWVNSANLNKSGKPYKNLVAVTPAA